MMKKLKKSVMLLVALATVGITLMSHTSLLKHKATWETSRCFKPDLTVKYRCVSSDATLTSTSYCLYAQDFAEGAHVFNINPNTYIEADDIGTECYGSDSFCCAQVLTDQTWWGNLEGPCAGQPYFMLDGIYSQFEIDQVYCKED